MTKRSRFARQSRQLLLCVTAALAITGSAFAQTASSGAAKPADEGGYSKWDVDPFVGWQWFQIFQGSNIRPHKFESGVVWGGRVTEDFSNHFALEQSLSLGYNRLELKPTGQANFMSLGETNATAAIDAVYHFQPRTAKVRIFLLTGPGFTWYMPSGMSTARQPAGGFFIPPSQPTKTIPVPAFTYGGGVKINVNKTFGVRFDVRGLVTPTPHFNLPDQPGAPGSLYIPRHGTESALMATVGLVVRGGWVEPPPPPNPLISQSLRVDVPAAAGGTLAITGAHDVCPGEDERLTVNAAGFANPTYQWFVNGQPAAGATGNSFAVPTATGSGARAITVTVSSGTSVGTSAPFTTEAGHTYHLTAEPAGLGGRAATYQWLVNGQPLAGATGSTLDLPVDVAKSVTVRVTAAGATTTSAPANMNIRSLTPPTITFAVNPNTMPYTAPPVPLAAVATASPCGAPATVRYSGEGVTGASFNPGSVSGFDMSNRIRQQTKVVRITATATDTRNLTATATADVTVTLGTEATRLDDVVFQSMSSRVNNCGKRLLLEELTPMLRNDPGAKVILIGHRDEKEKGAAAAKLDEARVLNAAAVLSAGKGICPQLDLSRILMNKAGTDQTSKTRPALCGASTNVKERPGQAVKESDKSAEFRRVEIWFVPSGAADPAGVSGTPVPTDAVTKLGCPK
jgi:hypothetical protein